MKKSKHKYFRNKRYKEKLDNKYIPGYANKHKYYITHEPDTRYEREYWVYWLDHGYKYYPFNEKQRGRHYWLYFEKPEVPYTIKIKQNHRKYPAYLRKVHRRRIRKTYRNEVIDGGLYKKYNEYWWDID